MSSTTLTQSEWNEIFETLGKIKEALDVLDASGADLSSLRSELAACLDGSDDEREAYGSLDPVLKGAIASPAAHRAALVNWVKNAYFTGPLLRGRLAITARNFAKVYEVFADRFDDNAQRLAENSVDEGALEGDADNTGLTGADKGEIFKNVSATQSISDADTVYVEDLGATGAPRKSGSRTTRRRRPVRSTTATSKKSLPELNSTSTTSTLLPATAVHSCRIT